MSLIAWYPLFQNNTSDYSVHKNNAINNNAFVDNKGKIGSCYSFNGISSYLLGGKILQGTQWGEFTICALVYPYSNLFSSNQTIVSYENNFLKLRIQNSGYACILLNDESGLETIQFDHAITPNKWCHIAITYVDGKLMYFIDGQLKQEKMSSKKFIKMSRDTNLFIGTHNGASEYFSGKLNDVRIYNHGLSCVDVRELSRVKIAHWKFNNRNGYDSSGYKLSLKVTGNPTQYTTTNHLMGVGCYRFQKQYSHRIETSIQYKNPTDQLTLSAWVYLESYPTGDRYGVIIKPSNYYLTVNNTGYVSAYWYGTSNQGYHTASSGKLDLKKWYLITSVWDGTKCLIYVNAKLVHTTNTTTTNAYNTDSSIIIGGDTSSRWFDGYIDDARIYGTALTQQDINDLLELRFELDERGSFYAYNVAPLNASLKEVEMTQQGNLLSKDVSEVGIAGNNMLVFAKFKNNIVNYAKSIYKLEKYSTASLPQILPKYVNFNNSNMAIKIDNILKDRLQGSHTIIITEKSKKPTANMRLMAGYPTNYYEITKTTLGTYLFTIRDSNSYKSVSTQAYVDDSLRMITCVLEAGSIKKSSIYVNGVFEASRSDLLLNAHLSDNLLIGNWTTLSQGYIGEMYEIKIFNRALTPTEIKLEYETRIETPMSITEDGIVYVRNLVEY